MKYYLLIIGLFIGVLMTSGQSQSDFNSISTGSWMYDLNPSPFVNLYKMDYFEDDDGNKKSIKDILANEDIRIDDLPYIVFNYQEKSFFALKKKNDELRLFKVLSIHDDFFILCNRDDSFCDCKSETFLYFKPESKLQRIQRPFSFSLKRNLVKRLDDFGIAVPSHNEEMNFCDMLKSL